MDNNKFRNMKNILENKRFIVDNNGDTVGVLIDINTYKKMESFYEDFVLGKKMDKAKKSKSYSFKDAAKK